MLERNLKKSVFKKKNQQQSYTPYTLYINDIQDNTISNPILGYFVDYDKGPLCD